MLNCGTEEFVYKLLLGFVAFFLLLLGLRFSIFVFIMLILMWH